MDKIKVTDKEFKELINYIVFAHGMAYRVDFLGEQGPGYFLNMKRLLVQYFTITDCCGQCVNCSHRCGPFTLWVRETKPVAIKLKQPIHHTIRLVGDRSVYSDRVAKFSAGDFCQYCSHLEPLRLEAGSLAPEEYGGFPPQVYCDNCGLEHPMRQVDSGSE